MRGITQKVAIDFTLPLTRIADAQSQTTYSYDVLRYLQTQEKALHKAKSYLQFARTSDTFSAVSLYDQNQLEIFFRSLLDESGVMQGSSIRKHVLVAVPATMTAVDKYAVVSSLEHVGFSQVTLCSGTLAGAIGADVPVSHTKTSVIISFGYEVSEVTLISMSTCHKIESLYLTEQRLLRIIADQLFLHYNLLTDTTLLSHTLQELGTGAEEAGTTQSSVTIPSSGIGREPLTIPASFFYDTLNQSIESSIAHIEQFLQQLTPTQILDVMDQGILVYGSGFHVPLVVSLVSKRLKIPVYTTPTSDECVIKGLRTILLKRTFDL